MVTYRKIIHNRIGKIEAAEKDSGATAKLFTPFCTPRLALPKNIPLELMRILSFLGLEKCGYRFYITHIHCSL